MNSMERIKHLAERAGIAADELLEFLESPAGRRMRHVLAGETWQPEDGEGTASPTGATVAERMKALTPQQHNILGLIVAGKPNKIIAYELDIAETTVKAHVTLILRKLGVFSRTQAVLAARDFFD